MPRICFSGQARTHAPDPMHFAGSISGWIDEGTASSPSASIDFATIAVFLWRCRS